MGCGCGKGKNKRRKSSRMPAKEPEAFQIKIPRNMSPDQRRATMVKIKNRKAAIKRDEGATVADKMKERSDKKEDR